MIERIPETPDIFIDGRPLRGRTYQREDGTYESFDLVGAEVGDVITLITPDGAHEIIKGEGDERASSMENWLLPNSSDQELGSRAVTLTLLEPNPTGASFLTPGVVIREGLEVGYTDRVKPHIIKTLGIAGTILVKRSADQASEQPRERIAG